MEQKKKIINLSPEKIVLSLFLILAYFIAGKLGLKLAFFNSSATAFWPPTGISIAAFLLLGYEIWPAIFIGAFLVNITTTPTILTCLGIALGNTLEGLTAAYLVNTYANGWRFFKKTSHTFKYIIYACGFASAVSASIGVITLIWTGYANPSDLPQLWFTWWFGDLGGALIKAPFLIVWFKSQFDIKITRGKLVELFAFLAAYSVIALIIFADISPINVQHYSLKYMAILVIVWAAYRFGNQLSTLTIIALSLIGIVATLQGRGPFVSEVHSPNESLVLLQIFMSVMSITGLVISALISEEKESNEKVIGSEERYRNLVHMAPDVIYSISSEGKFTDLNPAFERITGWKATDWLGKSFIEIVHPEDRKIALTKFKSGMQGGPSLNFELRILTKWGRYVIGSFSSTPKIENGQVVGKFGVARDITFEKEIDKMKNEFFTITAHQLRTPLTHIRWNIEMILKKNKNVSDTMKKGLDQIYLDDKKMIEMINKLIKIVRFQQGQVPNKPEEINVTMVLKKIIKEYQTDAEAKSLKINLTLATDPLPIIYVDQNKFNEIVENLISNAIKYTDKGQITVRAESDGKSLELSVADTGIGIPKDEKSNIFNQFFRAENAVDKKTEGSGLGLNLIKNYVDSMGGEIWFQSEEGKGSTFFVKMPLKA